MKWLKDKWFLLLTIFLTLCFVAIGLGYFFDVFKPLSKAGTLNLCLVIALLTLLHGSLLHETRSKDK